MYKTIFFFLVLIAPGLLPGQERIRVNQTFHYEVSGRINRLQSTQVLPPDIPGRQTVLDISYSHPPTGIHEKGGATYAYFDLYQSELKSPLTITYDMLIFPYDYKTAGERKAAAAPSEEDLSPFLKKEAYINPGHKKMLEVASTIHGSSEEEIVRNVFQFVTNHMEYRRFNQQERGAVLALKQGKGDCTEYSELMVSLCRAKDIPARLVYGAAVGGDNLRGNFLHNWVEVYFKGRGWVPFDPTFADCPFDDCPTTFDRMPATYIYFSFDRSGGDSRYQYQLSSTGHVHANYDFHLERVSENALRRAERFLQKAAPDSALACLDGVFPEGFEHFETNLLQMEAHLGGNAPDEALRHLQKAGSLTKTSEEKAAFLLASAQWHTINGDTANALNQLEKYMTTGKALTGKPIKILENGTFYPLLSNPRFAKILKADTLEYLLLCNSLAFPDGITLTDYRLAMPDLHFPAWQDQTFADRELYHLQPLAESSGIRRVEVEGAKPARWYEFDEQGRLRVKQQNNQRQETGYDAAGRKSVVKTFLAEEHSVEVLSYTRHYIYGTGGALAEIWGCAGDCGPGSATSLLRFGLEGNGGTTVQRYDNRGQPVAKIIVAHDKARLTELTFQLAGETAAMQWKFDSAENKVTRQLLTPDTSFVLEFFTLNSHGRIGEGNLLFPKHRKIMYEYDTAGRLEAFYLLEVNVLKPPSILFSDTYQYDKKGILKNAAHYIGYYIERPHNDPKFDVRSRQYIRYAYKGAD